MSTTSVRLTKTVTEHYNLGSYEFIEVTATVEWDAADRHLKPGDYLDALLRPQRAMAKALTTENNSFIHEHPALADDPIPEN